MAQAELQVEIRENTGKGVARKLRAAGKIPAVVYGREMAPTPIIVEPKTLETAISTEAGWNTMLTLRGEAELDGLVVILKDLKQHPLKPYYISADLYALDINKKGYFNVPVVALGTSKGQKEGGSLQVIRKELEVFCLPADVPQSIEINVEELEIGDVVHIEEVSVPDRVEIPYDVNFTVITVVGIKEEVEETEEGEELEEIEAVEEAAEDVEE